MRSKGAPGGLRGPRQASPRALAIGGLVVVAAIVAVVLGIVLSGGKSAPTSTTGGSYPATGSHTWGGALPGATYVYNLFKGIPQNGLVLGSPNAPATLTEFIDLQCPDCQIFETQQLPDLVRKYVRTGKLDIKVEPWSILDRPGTPPDSARGQAATIAASLQNRGFEFAEMLYLNQGTEETGWLTPDMVGRAASSVDGVKPRQVLSDLGSSPVKSVVHTVDSTAAAQQFSATPTLLLNRRGKQARVISVGVPSLSTLESEIDAAIAG